MSAPPNSSVSVFHFTSRISNAKIRKYKLATERGMGPGSANGAMAVTENGNAIEQTTGDSPTPPTPTTESPPAEQPPTKKPRLKLNVGKRKSDESPEDTIRVSQRQKREPIKFHYSQDMDMTKPDAAKPVESPAPSSGLSSLSSAPPSEREESPFMDPPADPANGSQDYGDFMSYYIAGGDDEEADSAKKSAKPKPRGRPRGAKTKSRVESEPKPKQAQAPPQPPAKPATPADKVQQQLPPPQQQPPKQQPPQPNAPHGPQNLPPQQQPQQQQAPPPQRQGQHVPPPYPAGPPLHRGLPPPAPPPRIPQPIINFIDIVHDPKPAKPDSIVVMIRKLEELSSALTNFGGVPAIPPTPEPEQAVEKPAPKPAPKPKEPKKPAKPAATDDGDNVDTFLSFFGGEEDDEDDDDEDDDESESSKEPDLEQPVPGSLDGPLMYGIQFIQNALKSWAQQRMTHQVTQQWNAQQQQQIQQQQMQQQRRGPGRPRRYDEPNFAGPAPIIHMDLKHTPEGVAIKAFQSVLDSGCLQVNGVLPKALARALRHLYMQIDHLINQGSKPETNFQCMSYTAQINAQKARVDKWKAQQARAQEETARQQQIANQQVMAQMGLEQHQMAPGTAENAQRMHAIELERRRSMQHAAQQPYISKQHLNPLQLDSRTPGTPTGAGPSQSPSTAAPANQTSTPADKEKAGDMPTAVMEAPDGTEVVVPIGPDGRPQVPSALNNGGAGQVQLDKMKLYMPGFLPRSGQSMKFSFAPHSEAALRMFGEGAFPAEQANSNLPNRGPMSAPPGSNSVSEGLPNGPSSAPLQGSGSAAAPIQIDSDTTAEHAFGADVEMTDAPPAKQASEAPTSGFKPINAPAPRPSSVPAEAPKTSSSTAPPQVQIPKHPSGTASANASPALNSSIIAVSKITGVPMPTNFPHPGAVVVDQ